MEINRRMFITGAGAAFLLGLSARESAALAGSRTLFATAFMDGQKNYGFAIVTEKGELVQRQTLPGRAHGFAWSPDTGRAVAFARRPGNFAIAFDPSSRRAPVLFHAPQGRHFYGHGVFSADGRLLYAAENDFEAGKGKIGIYDASGNFERITELETFGVGPHEIIFLRDGTTLAIANGGIRTHPDFGRAKLNLAQMQSSIVLVDSQTGSLLGRFDLPPHYQRMSLRHMVHASDESLWIGGQFEGDPLADVSPVIRLDRNGTIAPVELPDDGRAILGAYVGAVALSADGRHAGFSSPKGGGYVTIDTTTRQLVMQISLPRNSGLAASSDGMLASSEFGQIGRKNYPLHWDNHILALK